MASYPLTSVSFFDRFKQGWRNLPLLCLLLPLYPLPLNGMAMRIAQFQLFQVLAVAAFVLTARKTPITFWHPARLFAFVSICYLFFPGVNSDFLFNMQMILLGFILFQTVAESRAGYRFAVNILYILLVITFIYTIFQYFKLDHVKPIYFREENTWTMHGFWMTTAFCSTFAAMVFPFILSETSKIKWPLLAIDLWVLLNCHSSIAVLAVVIISLVFLARRSWKLFFIAGAVICILGFIYIKSDFGDFSSLDQRFYIWKVASELFWNAPVFGHGFSAFYQVGFENIFVIGSARGSFFPEAHNEYLNLAFEMGFIGVLISVLLIARIIYVLVANKYNQKIISLGLSVIGFSVIAFVQPVCHAANTVILPIVLYGLMESYHRRKYAD